MMKFEVFPLLALLVLLIGLVANGQMAVLAALPSQQEPPLRLSEPTDVIIDDLENYIPDYMHEKNIPGVAIALIRDGEIVWTEGFGVANAITRKPVTPETAFEFASNSKVVTAYIALQLVDQGSLSLDEPLNAYLPEPWLPPSEYRDTIALRHVLSHSSGLGQIGKESLFAPGRGYYYSGSGLLYLQAVIEHVTGQSLEGIAQKTVFVPLGMSSSSFVNPTEITPRTANGHVRAFVPVLLFTVLFVVSLVIVGLIGLFILRIRTGQWRPTRWLVIEACAAAFTLSLLLVFVLIRMTGWLEFAWLIAFCAIIYPEHGFGVVVCTNNDLLSPDVAIEIAHRALGGKTEPIRQAIHLEFNYGEGNY